MDGLSAANVCSHCHWMFDLLSAEHVPRIHDYVLCMYVSLQRSTSALSGEGRGTFLNRSEHGKLAEI